MIDSQDAFRHLTKPERYVRIREGVAEAVASTDSLPDASQVSQLAKDIIGHVGEIVCWAHMIEEREFTGDPVAPLPQYPETMLVLDMLGLLPPPVDHAG